MTPPIAVPDEGDAVHVFRVDTIWKSPGQAFLGMDEASHSLKRIPLVNDSAPAQIKASLDSGLIIIGIALNHHFQYRNGLHVRLYRPGYELIEFNSSQWREKVKWRRASSFAARETTIDKLIGACASDSVRPTWSEVREGEPLVLHYEGILSPGSHSKEHKSFLVFAAQEYERLAGQGGIPRTQADNQRVLGKARALGRHANLQGGPTES